MTTKDLALVDANQLGLDVLSRYFKRSITIDNTYYRGDINTTTLKKGYRLLPV